MIDPEKEKARKMRHRAKRHRFEFLTEPEVIEQFKTLPGLEDLSHSDRLKALIQYWQEKHLPVDDQKPDPEPFSKGDAWLAENASDIPYRTRIEQRLKELWYKWEKRPHGNTFERKRWRQLKKENRKIRAAFNYIHENHHPKLAEFILQCAIPFTPTALLTLVQLELGMQQEIMWYYLRHFEHEYGPYQKFWDEIERQVGIIV